MRQRRGCGRRCGVGTSHGAATRPSTTWPACGILSFVAGFSTTAVSTSRPCTRSSATSTACWSDGPCGNTRGYGGIVVAPATGSAALLVARPGCSPTGICWLMHPLILQASDHAEDLSIHPLFHEHASERLHQPTNPILGPIGEVVVQHQPLPKQRPRSPRRADQRRQLPPGGVLRAEDGQRLTGGRPWSDAIQRPHPHLLPRPGGRCCTRRRPGVESHDRVRVYSTPLAVHVLGRMG